MKATETMASVALVLAVVPPSKVSHRLKDFPTGSALCEKKVALPSQR